jgi:hypothetical protein
MAIKEILETPRYHEAAQKLAKSMVGEAQSSRAGVELEGLALSGFVNS